MSCFLVSLALLGVSIIIAIIASLTYEFLAAGEWVLIFIVATVLVAVWINLSITTQRLKDIGLSPWWLVGVIIAWAIPVVGGIVAILLLIWPGESGDNAYGPDPLKMSTDKAATVNGEFSSPPPPIKQGGEHQAHDANGPAKYPDSSGSTSKHVSLENDEQHYLDAHEELKTGQIDKGLWIKCLTLENGDKAKAKFRYVRERVTQKKLRVTEPADDKKPGASKVLSDPPKQSGHDERIEQQDQTSSSARGTPATKPNSLTLPQTDSETKAAKAAAFGLSEDHIEYLGIPIVEFDYLNKYKVSKGKLYQAIHLGKIRSVVCRGSLWLQDKRVF